MNKELEKNKTFLKIHIGLFILLLSAYSALSIFIFSITFTRGIWDDLITKFYTTIYIFILPVILTMYIIPGSFSNKPISSILRIQNKRDFILFIAFSILALFLQFASIISYILAPNLFSSTIFFAFLSYTFSLSLSVSILLFSRKLRKQSKHDVHDDEQIYIEKNSIKVIDFLRSGSFGIKLVLPDHFVVHSDNGEFAEVVDEVTQVVWYLYLFPNLHFNLAHDRSGLEQYLEWNGKYIFETSHQDRHLDDDAEPRTTDLSWSPLIDAEYLSIQGAQALRTVHRMAYEPGYEVVMGHLLIPLQQGLFEARVITFANLTGFRESMLVTILLSEKNPKDQKPPEQLIANNMRQQDMDSVSNDEKFPEHCLSRARNALNWFCHEADFQVTEPKSSWESGETRLLSLGCTLVPPPRFVYENHLGESYQESFHRVSFCGTDGVEIFQITEWGQIPEGSNFVSTAESIAHEISKDAAINYEDMQVMDDRLLSPNGQPQVIVVAEDYYGSRSIISFFLDEFQRIWSLIYIGTVAIPLDAVIRELESTIMSFCLDTEV